MGLKIYAPPSELAVSLADARQQCRVTSTAEDAYLLALVNAAADWADGFTNRRLITQTWDWFLDAFPCSDALEVPYAPLQSVSSITYQDSAGATQTLSTSDYVVDTKSTPARISLAYGKTWPVTYCQINAVTVRFVCGYGGPGAVPFAIKAGCLLHVQAHYDRDERQMEKLIEAAQALLFPYKVWAF
jgi:uncharacterized phiE125 gp8 family phage protein